MILEHPWRREDLRIYLKSLSDINYQWDVWVNKLPHTPGRYDNLDSSIHFLYDDTTLADNASEAIGWFLKDESEAEAIRQLVAAIDVVFDRYGLELQDAEYIATPEWAAVLQAAMRARELIM